MADVEMGSILLSGAGFIPSSLSRKRRILWASAWRFFRGVSGSRLFNQLQPEGPVFQRVWDLLVVGGVSLGE